MSPNGTGHDLDNQLKKELLVQEYANLHQLIRLFFSGRAIILGMGLTVWSGLLQFIYETNPEPSYVYDFLVVIIPLGISRMMIPTVRASYVFQSRLSEIAKKANIADYWTVWPKYVKHRPDDSGTKAFELVLYFIYLATVLHVVVRILRELPESMLELQELTRLHGFLGMICPGFLESLPNGIRAALLLAVLRDGAKSPKKMRPEGFQDEIAKSWKRASSDANVVNAANQEESS